MIGNFTNISIFCEKLFSNIYDNDRKGEGRPGGDWQGQPEEEGCPGNLIPNQREAVK